MIAVSTTPLKLSGWPHLTHYQKTHYTPQSNTTQNTRYIHRQILILKWPCPLLYEYEFIKNEHFTSECFGGLSNEVIDQLTQQSFELVNELPSLWELIIKSITRLLSSLCRL